MEPTSLPVLVALATAALAAPVALVLLFRRLRGTRRLVPALVAGVLAAQVVAITAVGAVVNRSYGFYPTWGSLFGEAEPVPHVAAGTPLGLVNGGLFKVRHPFPGVLKEPPGDKGRYVQWAVKGPYSHITQEVSAWLPPQYYDHRFARTRFPVVMVLGGAFSSSSSVFTKLDFANLATAAIRSGKVGPFVAVYPQLNVALPADTECINFPNGVQSFTWLGVDVPVWAKTHLRVTSDGRRWSVFGWSTGGYCSAKLHLIEPQVFGAAASVEGYFEPEPDQTTGNLAQVLAANPGLREINTASWLIRNRPPRNPHLLVMTSMQDPQSAPSSLAFLKAARGTPGVQPYVVTNLGHSMPAFKAVTPSVLTWLASVADA